MIVLLSESLARNEKQPVTITFRDQNNQTRKIIEIDNLIVEVWNYDDEKEYSDEIIETVIRIEFEIKHTKIDIIIDNEKTKNTRTNFRCNLYAI